MEHNLLLLIQITTPEKSAGGNFNKGEKMNINQIIIKKDNRRIQGFTLVEMLIVIAILGILVTIAYPSYKASLLKSRRADALQTLSQDQIIL